MIFQFKLNSNMTAHLAQRASDHILDQQNIEEMIALEDDPKIRLQLMVMNRINLSLIANTTTINEINNKLMEQVNRFEQHDRREQAILNRGKGAWTLFMWVILVMQSIIGWGWYDTRSDLRELHVNISEIRSKDAGIEATLSGIKERFNGGN